MLYRLIAKKNKASIAKTQTLLNITAPKCSADSNRNVKNTVSGKQNTSTPSTAAVLTEYADIKADEIRKTAIFNPAPIMHGIAVIFIDTLTENTLSNTALKIPADKKARITPAISPDIPRQNAFDKNNLENPFSVRAQNKYPFKRLNIAENKQKHHGRHNQKHR